MEWSVMEEALVKRPVALTARAVAETRILAPPACFACYAVSLAGAAAGDTRARGFVSLIKLVGNGYDRLDFFAGRGRSGSGT
jgi:hypothetical protein